MVALLQSPSPNLRGVSQQAGPFLQQGKVAVLRERVTASNVFSKTHFLLIRDKLSPLYFLAFPEKASTTSNRLDVSIRIYL